MLFASAEKKAACCRPVYGVSSRAAPRPSRATRAGNSSLFRHQPKIGPGTFPLYRPQAAFTLVELLVVVAIIGVLIALLVPGVQKACEAANRAQCLNNLKQIGIALHGYHDVYQTFPHAYDARALFHDPSQTPVTPGSNQYIVTQSWATLILPFIEQDNLGGPVTIPIVSSMCPFTSVPPIPGLPLSIRGRKATACRL